MKHNITFSSSKETPEKTVIWLSDLHLDAASQPRYERFLELIHLHQPDIILIGGDIANGNEAFRHLETFAHLFEIPLYFVLGNHDFYFGSILKTRNCAKDLCAKSSHLHYLTDLGVIPLSKHTAIIGHDGWSDGRAGNFLTSNILLNDYLWIEELKGLNPQKRLKILNDLGSEAAESIDWKLDEAFERFDQVILLTHTPPFLEACYYGEHPTDSNWSPHFVCQALGEVLKEKLKKIPEKYLLVLCGHTHTGIDVHIAPNLRVLSGESILGAPSIQGLIYVA